jgi:CBS domain-containing protein
MIETLGRRLLGWRPFKFEARMAQPFDATNPPFDRLTTEEIAAVKAVVDMSYHRPGETLIAKGRACESLFVVFKGSVEERDGEELIGLRGPGDFFDSRALIQGVGATAFIAREETLCHILPRALALRLIAQNARFGAFFYLEVSRKLEAVAEDDEQARLGPTMRARVRDLALHSAHFIDGTESIVSAGARMEAVRSDALFVRAGEQIGIVTGMNLGRSVVLKGVSIERPVASVAHYDLVAVDEDAFVSHALLQMTKHNKRRVAVARNGEYVAILEDIDLLSFLAGNSQLVAARIDRAGAISDLVAPAKAIETQVRMLRRQGVRIEVVAEIVSDLNRRLFAKLFQLTASEQIQRTGSLIVMGSEGRGEQTVRTDQDNGLILADDVPEDDLRAFRATFSQALEKLGFPPCPGNVMVSNPAWSRTLAEYREDFRRWLSEPDEAAAMNVAIFYDAAVVAGLEEPLRRAKAELIEAARGETLFLAHFARAADAFPTPIGIFRNLITSKEEGDALDVKKGGIFPIIHGVRALSLERGLVETSTAGRIDRLSELGVFTREFARDLAEALNFLITLRLDHQLAAAGGGLVRPRELSSMDRDLLRDAFQVVKQLREIIRRHFNLAMF